MEVTAPQVYAQGVTGAAGKPGADLLVSHMGRLAHSDQARTLEPIAWVR
jgi:hypothetical protein